MEQGLIGEAVRLKGEGLSLKRMRELGLEYKVLADFLEKKITSLEGEAGFISILQTKIHQYAKRQLTWFKKDKEIIWFDISSKDYQKKLENKVLAWYNSPSD